MSRRSTRIAIVGAAVSWGLVVAPALGQEATGALYGQVSDPAGDPLPGVVVAIEGPGERWAQETDREGGFRFLKLAPGLYGLEARLQGWAALEYQEIEIRAGRNTTLRLSLDPRVDEAITVDTASPLLDERKLDQGTRLGELELERIPTARDPWAVLTQAPGVLTDRIQVGGTRGRQARFTALGAGHRENDVVLDGVQITDMALAGSSPTYYDFDQLEEIQVVTGGTDVTKPTAGVSLNLVTRRGTNRPRGSARYLLTDGAFESSPDVDPADFPPGQGEIETDRLESIESYGLELGGPLLRDRLWGWGSWGRNDIVEQLVGGHTDPTTLENTAVKLNAQPLAGSSLVASWNHGDKRKPNRVNGPFGPGVATRTQKGPTPIWKLEGSQMIGGRAFLTGTYGRVEGGFSVIANACRAAGGCEQAPESLLDSDGVFRGSFFSGEVEQPSEQWGLDASYFVAGAGLSQELRLGARYRDFENEFDFFWPGGRNLWHIAGENFGAEPGPVDFFFVQRGNPPPTRQTYTSLWLQDTLSVGRWTANLGLRYDLQQGEKLTVADAANPAFPDVLPAVTVPGSELPFDWETWSPRLGVTRSLGAERQTLLRASYARFAAGLGADHVGHDNPAGEAQALYRFSDGDGDNRWTDVETDGTPTLLAGFGFDPANPTALTSPNRADPDLEPPLTDELLLALEHSFTPDLALGLHLTYRRTADMLEERTLVRDAAGDVRPARRDDYTLETTLAGELPNGQPYSADFYALDPALGLAFTGGTLLTNGDREVVYRGAALTLEKRLTDRWLARAHFNYGKAEWEIPASYFAFDDPTDASPMNDFSLGGIFDSDGDVFAEVGVGTLLQSDWSFNLAGLVRIAPEGRWGFDVTANVGGRQGYPLAYEVAFASHIDGRLRRAQATERIDDSRTDDVYTLDLGVQKPIALPRGLTILVIADLFNALNEGTVLRRSVTLNGGRASFVEETLSPRIWRLGLRVTWN
jgi:hypothetical protein